MWEGLINGISSWLKVFIASVGQCLLQGIVVGCLYRMLVKLLAKLSRQKGSLLCSWSIEYVKNFRPYEGCVVGFGSVEKCFVSEICIRKKDICVFPKKSNGDRGVKLGGRRLQREKRTNYTNAESRLYIFLFVLLILIRFIFIILGRFMPCCDNFFELLL